MLRRGVERKSARILHLLMNLLHRLAVYINLAGSSRRQEFSAGSRTDHRLFSHMKVMQRLMKCVTTRT